MSTSDTPALREKETFAQAERRKRDERFRKALAADPDLTTAQLAERFGMRQHEINRWCDRLGLPRPGQSDGVFAATHPDDAVRKRRERAARKALSAEHRNGGGR